MPQYSYALIACICWAVSSPTLNSGFRRLEKDDNLITNILTGLLISHLSGTIFLFLMNFNSITNIEISKYLILGGLFVFPIGTVCYYLSGKAFGEHLEYASQFANVKPMISIFLAFYILHEAFDSMIWISISFIALGIGVLLSGALNKSFSWLSLIAGFTTALMWSIGEIFMKMGMENIDALEATFTALFSGTLLLSATTLPYLIKNRKRINNVRKWKRYFVEHGIISFAIGYTFFFQSVRTIGLVNTILITVFWPGVAMGITKIINKRRKRNAPVPKAMIIAMTLLIVGSLSRIIIMN